MDAEELKGLVCIHLGVCKELKSLLLPELDLDQWFFVTQKTFVCCQMNRRLTHWRRRKASFSHKGFEKLIDWHFLGFLLKYWRLFHWMFYQHFPKICIDLLYFVINRSQKEMILCHHFLSFARCFEVWNPCFHL